MIPIIVEKEKCLYPESTFSFLFDIMVTHSKQLQFMCVWCPFGFCYRYFLGIFAIFQMVSAHKVLTWKIVSFCFSFRSTQVYSLTSLRRLLQHPRDDVWINVPFLNIPITHHNFDMMSHALNLSTCFDLFIRVLTSEVNDETFLWQKPLELIKNCFQSADEFATFTMYSLVMLIYSLLYFLIKFGTFTTEQRVIQSIMNMASILNFMFMVCFIFEHCDHGAIVHKHKEW